MAGFFTAPRIAWGPGAVEQLSGLGARRAIVAVDPAIARQDGHRRILEELAKSDTGVEVVADLADPDGLEAVESLAGRLVSFAPDWVVAVGGGRTIDGAKAARLHAERPDVPIGTVTPVLDLPDPPRTRLVAIPTTSGSGAEASGTLDLVSADGSPIDLAHRAATPDWALVDPSFAGALPRELVLDGAFETAAQSLEAYLSAWSNPFSDALAADALATVFARLPHALRWSDDPDARAALHFAATSAGLASSNAQRGIAHALARSLVGPSGLAYGRLLAIALAPVLEFDRPSARDRLEALAATLAPPEERTRGPLDARVVHLLETFRVPTTLVAAGVDPARIDAVRPRIVADVLRSPACLANPRVASAADVGALLDRLLGRRPPGA